MTIRPEGLTRELTIAGIQFSGCNAQGIVWDLMGNEIQNQPNVAAVIAAHDASAWMFREERDRVRIANAEDEARLAVQLRTLTPQQAVDYIETNVLDLPSAKSVLKIMARMLIAMRNRIFPDLPE